MHFTKSAITAALSAAPLVLAQTFTDCNPLEKSCPNDTGLEASTFSSNFATDPKANASWSVAQGTTLKYGSNGAEFIINKAGQAPTVQTDFYIFFGKIEVVMQAAAGTGIVSSIVLESDDLDEIDWEFLGGNTAQVETNYFGKGNTSTYDRAIYYPVSSPQTTFHTYTIDWTSSYVKFSIDGAVVRTLNYADANGGSNFPQTPMRLKLGNWAGGAAGQPAGTVEWAGGATDFTKSPFTMYVKSVSIQNYSPAQEYQWTDKTGSYQSIKLIKGDGSSSVESAGSSTTTATVEASNSSYTLAPTSFHSVKQVQQTAAAVASTSSGAAPSTTVASMMSSSSPTSTASSDDSDSSASSSASASESAAASSSSEASSSASTSATSTDSSAPAQQTTSGAGSNGVATAVVALGSIAFAFMML